MGNKLASTKQGWVIINIGHPTTGWVGVYDDTFKRTKKEAIAEFIKDTNEAWSFWHRKYKFRCVRAAQEISVDF